MSVSDKFAIFELMNNYVLAIDSHNNEQFADNFADNGVYESPWGTAVGRDAIIGNIAYWHSSGITAGKRHFTGSIRVFDLTETTAQVESNYWIAEAQTSPGIIATGYYVDEVQKINGVWKIVRRKQVVDPSYKFE
jgi:SnoaL-like domain